MLVLRESLLVVVVLHYKIIINMLSPDLFFHVWIFCIAPLSLCLLCCLSFCGFFSVICDRPLIKSQIEFWQPCWILGTGFVMMDTVGVKLLGNQTPLFSFIWLIYPHRPESYSFSRQVWHNRIYVLDMLCLYSYTLFLFFASFHFAWVAAVNAIWRMKKMSCVTWDNEYKSC